MKTCIYICLLTLTVGLKLNSNWNPLDPFNLDGNKAPTDNDEAKPVFFSVAMDAVASSHFWKVNLLSIRKLGNFTGPIIILTNYPKCAIDNLGKELLGDTPPKEYGEVQVFAGPKPGMSIHIKTVGNSTLQNRKMGYEEHKPLARWHAKNAHLPFSNFTIIAIDDDILVGKNLTHFLETVSQTKQLAVFRDMGGMAGQTYHCGIVVIPGTPIGEECAQQWYGTLKQMWGGINFAGESSDWNSDFDGAGQKAFGQTECAHKGNVTILSNKKEGFGFPVNAWLTLEKMDPDTTTHTFMHFTNSHRLKHVIDIDKMVKFYNELMGEVGDIEHNDNSPNCESNWTSFGVFAR